MDFLLLLPRHRRVVLEIDGLQHYADPEGRASPERYAEMVAADRELRLAGYEVYRFGGHEIAEEFECRRSKSCGRQI
jgi:very-short-patch-repair endonuclease